MAMLHAEMDSSATVKPTDPPATSIDQVKLRKHELEMRLHHGLKDVKAQSSLESPMTMDIQDDLAVLIDKQNESIMINDGNWNTTQETIAELVQAQLQLFQSQAELKQTMQTIQAELKQTMQTMTEGLKHLTTNMTESIAHLTQDLTTNMTASIAHLTQVLNKNAPHAVSINHEVTESINALTSSISDERTHTTEVLESSKSTVSDMVASQKEFLGSASSMFSAVASNQTALQCAMNTISNNIAATQTEFLGSMSSTVTMLANNQQELKVAMSAMGGEMMAANNNMANQQHMDINNLANALSQAVKDDRLTTVEMISSARTSTEKTNSAISDLTAITANMVQKQQDLIVAMQPPNHPSSPKRLSPRSTPIRKVRRTKTNHSQ